MQSQYFLLNLDCQVSTSPETLVFEMIHCKSSKLEVQIPHIPTGLIHFDFEAILGSMK